MAASTNSSTSQLKSAPTSFRERLKYLGPSLIVTANIVGAGELIMTTTLGAKAGFIALWVILFSCIVKVMVQLEFGKHAISTGETTLQGFSKLPGPKIGKGHWSIWMWLVVKIVHFIQYGGMIGGVALALNIAIPGIPVWLWAWIMAFLVVGLVLGSGYKRIEKTAVLLIAVFSLFTIFCVFLLQSTEYAISGADILEGMSFQMPAAVIGVALGAFGITGVSSDEAISYPYWCLEKGYAQYTGPNEDNNAWLERAKGWIRVMYLDAFLSMLIYTVTTAAFYMLGAAVLHKMGTVPQGNETIEVLSQMYTQSIGEWAKIIFLIGAVVVLFSSLFIAVVSNQRMYTDALAQLGVLDYEDQQLRNKWFRIWAWLLPIAWAILFVAVKAPVLMVTIGGLLLSFLLILVVFAAIHFRYARLDKRLRPSRIYDVLFWLSAITILGFGAQAILKLF